MYIIVKHVSNIVSHYTFSKIILSSAVYFLKYCSAEYFAWIQVNSKDNKPFQNAKGVSEVWNTIRN